jgi:hypothetical protein
MGKTVLIQGVRSHGGKPQLPSLAVVVESEIQRVLFSTTHTHTDLM